jgi:hypothetical protein
VEVFEGAVDYAAGADGDVAVDDGQRVGVEGAVAALDGVEGVEHDVLDRSIRRGELRRALNDVEAFGHGESADDGAVGGDADAREEPGGAGVLEGVADHRARAEDLEVLVL